MADPAYRFRSNAFTRARTYSLTDDALTWAEDGKPLDGVFLDQIAEVRLSFAPTRVSTNRYRTRVILRAGGMAELYNVDYRGFANLAEQNAEYVAFVTELHRRLAAKGRNVTFHGGSSPTAYAANLGLTGFVFVALAVLVLLVPIPAIAIVKLVIIAAFVPTLLRFLRRAKPVAYDPLRLPPGLLPSLRP